MLALQFPFVGYISSLPERYPNGFAGYVPRMAQPSAFGITQDVGPVVLPIIVTDTQLRDLGSGGGVESSLGWDIRFETPAFGKLAHQDLAYDPATGRKAVWLRFPLIRATELLDLRIYFGKPDLLASEADPLACWAGCLAAIDLGTGIDHSGNGADLVLTGVSADTLAGLAVGRYEAG